MNLETVTLAIEPRSVGACIDLAILFCRRHAGPILALTLLFAAPATLASYALTRQSDYGWIGSVLAFYFLAPYLGAALVGASGHHVFGEPFKVGAALRLVGARLVSLTLTLFLTRIVIAIAGLFCFGLAAAPLAARYGFFPEVLLLERLPLGRADRRIGEIMRNHFWDATGRYVAIACFAMTVWAALFVTVDQAGNWLLGVPIYFGKVRSLADAGEYVDLLFHDPVVVATTGAVAWVVYPVARLAWFFCYLDARIRKEGWDLELEFRVEARRLLSAFP